MMQDTNFGYSDTVMDHFSNPRNVLKTSEEEYSPSGVGMVGNPTCGDMMKVWIKVDETERIYDLKWKTFGCASAIGSTSMMSVMVTENGGMKVEDALKIKPENIMDRLGGLPSIKIHCSVLGDKALRAAINDYFTKSGQEGRILEKKAKIICECLNVTDHEIEEQVLEGAADFETLQERTKISTGCGKCRSTAIETFEHYRAKYFG
ncbi:MAG: iron-sulfur cluster assembly scaffold protein [Nitrospinae bacterium]|nr:iron-sulfur cluster assembly scaffold protein [Nitrospinota bacterium]